MANLNEYLDLAIRAHSGTSFVPEKRGQAMIARYNDYLAQDIAEIEKAAAGKDCSSEIENYVKVFKKYFSNWLSAKSRCLSTMITGGANFNVSRAEKHNHWEHNAWEKFAETINKAKTRIIKSFTEPVTMEDELQAAKMKLEKALERQELMKQVNKALRSKDATDRLMEIKGMTPELATEVQTKDCYGGTGFQSFQLTNNLAYIKRLQGKVRILESKQQAKEDPNQEVQKSFYTLVINTDIDRIQFLFDGKPDQQVISLMKKNAFRWFPTQKAWQRKITANANYATRQMVLELDKLG